MRTVKTLCQIIITSCMLVMLIPGVSQAACQVLMKKEITLPDIILTPSEKGTPGTVLYSQRLAIPALSYTCGPAVYSTWRSTFARSEFGKTSLDNVYSTGIAGIGVRIKWPASRGINAWVPGSYQCQGNCIEPADALLIEFVQTGNSHSGVITPGALMEVNVSADNAPAQQSNLLRIYNSRITVQVRSCSIVASTNHIDLGDYALADVVKSGVTVPKKPFQIALNCPQTSSAQIQFDGLTAWGEGPFLLKNKGSAQNVYVKLYSKYGPCANCYNELPLNQKIDFGTGIPFSGTRSVNYAAEMVFNENSRDKITAGNVDASVVFTLTID